MRTKTILLTAALVAAGVASSMAQSNVYSLNVVGYVNLTIPTGFSIINTPLDSGNNVDTNLFPTPANGTIIYTFGPTTGFVSDNYFNGWSGAGTLLNPGTGYFYFNPSTPITNTFVGTVVQGPTTNALNAGFTLTGSTAPVAGNADTALGFPAQNGTIVYEFVPGTGYVSYNYFNGWAPTNPPVTVGQGFFSFQPAATNWVNTFTVQ